MNTTASPNTIYVLDTSAIIEDPSLVLNLHGPVFIPAAVIKQLDGLKSSDPERALTARKASRLIEEAIMQEKARICHEYDHVDILESPADNKIVGAAMLLEREKGGRVVLLTTDRNMKIAAMSCGIESGVHVYEPVDIADDTFTAPAMGADSIYDKFVKWFARLVAVMLCYLIIALIGLFHR